MANDSQVASHRSYGDRVADAVKATVAFFADDNRGARYLTRHQPGMDGRCMQCRHPYPCSLIGIARAGVEMAMRRASRTDTTQRGAT